MSGERKNPWLNGLRVAGDTFLAVELVGAVIGGVVGFPMKDSALIGAGGAATGAFFSLFAAIPISIAAGGLAFIRSRKD